MILTSSISRDLNSLICSNYRDDTNIHLFFAVQKTKLDVYAVQSDLSEVAWFHWSIWLLLIQTLLHVWWDHPTSVMRWNLCGEIVETRLEFSSRDFSCMVPICGGQAQIGREHRRHCCKMTRDAIFMSYALSTKCLEPVLTVSWWCTIVPRGPRSNISLNTTFTDNLTTTLMTLREAGLLNIGIKQAFSRSDQAKIIPYPLRRLHPQQEEEEWSYYKQERQYSNLSQLHPCTHEELCKHIEQ